MSKTRREQPDFFDDNFFDPISAAIGPDRGRGDEEDRPAKLKEVKPEIRKKKAGFYLPVDLLDRFTRKFHELKLAGADIENKSALVELALAFTLDDIDKGENSRVLRKIKPV